MRVRRVEVGEQRAEGQAQRPVGLGCSSGQKVLGEGQASQPGWRLGPCQIRQRCRPPPEPAVSETGPEESVWM